MCVPLKRLNRWQLCGRWGYAVERRGLFLTPAPCPSGSSRALPCVSFTPESRLNETTVIRSSPLSWWQKETEPLRAAFKMPFSGSDCHCCSRLMAGKSHLAVVFGDSSVGGLRHIPYKNPMIFFLHTEYNRQSK